MNTLIQDQQTILFIGDSITDSGRRDERHRPLGCGYVNLFHHLLVIRDSEKRVNVLNRGISGHTINDLRSRWHDDVLAHRPDWLVIKIGINDIICYLEKDEPLDPASFATIYRQLIALTRKELPNCRLVLVDPFFGSDDRTEGSSRAKIAARLPDYLREIDTIACENGALHLKTHDLFKEKLRVQPASVYFTDEPVHPNLSGHLLIAESIYALLAS